jgi:hypothetical protein
LLLPGDIYASRQPDPVLQQIEQYHDLSISTNDTLPPGLPLLGPQPAGAADECNVKRDAGLLTPPMPGR